MFTRSLLLLALIFSVLAAVPAVAEEFLWEIGTPDGSAAEFALGPNGYGNYGDDGFYVVGWADASRDWPYAHPGPHDGWAGGRPHTFTVLFAVDGLPAEGRCRLHCRLVDTHAGGPPKLRVGLNGTEFHRDMPRGGGDASIHGEA